MASISRSNNIRCVIKTVLQSGNKSVKRFSTSCKREQIITSRLPPLTIPDKSLPDFLLDAHPKWNGRVAIECFETGKQYTYDEIPSRVYALAANLRNKFNLQDGDAVTVVLPNVVEYPIILMGITKANLVCTTCTPIYTAEEIRKQLQLSTTKLIITIDSIYETISEANKGLNTPLPIICLTTKSSKTPKGAFNYEDMISLNSNLDVLKSLKKVNQNDTALRMYSSGTTGLPKGVDLTHKNVIANLMQQEQTRCHIVPHLGDDYPLVVPGILPFFHIFGASCVMMGKIFVGQKVVNVPEFTVKNFVQVFKKYQPHALYLVPPLVLLMISHPGLTMEDFANVGVILVGAAPLGESDILRLRKKLPPTANVMQGYGLTETAPVNICWNSKIENYHPGSIGEVVSNTEARFVDVNTGTDVPHGKEGELWIRGPQVMKGYYGNEQATKDCITEDGWFKTGDIGFIAPDNQIFITDRLKELIKVKGFQVAPAELEAILRTHPSVIDAAVCGVPHPFYGEAPKAFIVVAPGKAATEKEIQDFVASKTAEYKHLSGGVHFIDTIPKSQAGKILRRELKAKYVTKN